jgi:heme A synthase
MQRFRRWAWLFVAYLVAVILFGAWVRIAGAGAGCGNHWPLCNGEVIPQAPDVKRTIEFTHRVTSGLCGVFAIGMLIWAWRLGDRAIRLAAIASLFFVLVEGFVGAVLVKRELVANDASASRAIVIALHLANTLLLTASATAMAWMAGPPVKAGRSLGRVILAGALVALVITNMTGAVTALGDTLFPVRPALDGSLLAKVSADLTSTQHFLVRLRAIHPMLAAMAAALLLGGLAALQRLYRGEEGVRKLILWPMALLVMQVALGVVNILLAAPGWMQILHLLLAQVLWIAAFAVTLTVWRAPQS